MHETSTHQLFAHIAETKARKPEAPQATKPIEAYQIKDTVVMGMMQRIHRELFPSESADAKMVAEYAKQMFFEITNVAQWIQKLPSIGSLEASLPSLSGKLVHTARILAESPQVTLRDPALAWKARRILVHMLNTLEIATDSKSGELRQGVGGISGVQLAQHINAEATRLAGVLRALPDTRDIKVVCITDGVYGYRFQLPQYGRNSLNIVVSQIADNASVQNPLRIDKSNMRDPEVARALVARLQSKAVRPFAQVLVSSNDIFLMLDPKQFDGFTLQERATPVHTLLHANADISKQSSGEAYGINQPIRRGPFIYDAPQAEPIPMELSKQSLSALTKQAEASLFSRLDKKSKHYVESHADRDKTRQHVQMTLNALLDLVDLQLQVEHSRRTPESGKGSEEYSMRGKDILSLIELVSDTSEILTASASGSKREKGAFRPWARAIIADVVERFVLSSGNSEKAKIIEKLYAEVIMQAGIRRNLSILEPSDAQEDMTSQVDYWLRDGGSNTRIPVQIKRMREYPDGPIQIHKNSTPLDIAANQINGRTLARKANTFFGLHPGGMFIILPYHMIDPVSLRIHPHYCAQSVDDIIAQLREGIK